MIFLNILALIALTSEASAYFDRQLQASNEARLGYASYLQLRLARDFSYSAIWLVYGAALMAAGFWRRSALLRWQSLVLIALTIVKVFAFDMSTLDKGYRILSFVALGAVLLAISFIYQRDWLKLSSRSSEEHTEEHSMKPSLGFLAAVLVVGPSIPFFKYQRAVEATNSGGQHYVVVDETIWQHANSDLTDLRLYSAGREIPYALEVETRRL